MSIYDDSIEKVVEAAADIADGISKPYADRDKYDDYINPPYETSDTPPNSNYGVEYTNLDDYDGNDDYDYVDGEYYKK